MRVLTVAMVLVGLVLAGCQSTSGKRDDDDKPSIANGWRGTHNYSSGGP